MPSTPSTPWSQGHEPHIGFSPGCYGRASPEPRLVPRSSGPGLGRRRQLDCAAQPEGFVRLLRGFPLVLWWRVHRHLRLPTTLFGLSVELIDPLLELDPLRGSILGRGQIRRRILPSPPSQIRVAELGLAHGHRERRQPTLSSSVSRIVGQSASKWSGSAWRPRMRRRTGPGREASTRTRPGGWSVSRRPRTARPGAGTGATASRPTSAWYSVRQPAKFLAHHSSS